MATYPSTVPNFGVDPKGSAQMPIDDLQVDVWPNGRSRGRSYYPVGKYQWTLVHSIVADADKVTLKTFYDTNKLITFDFISPWDGVTYHNVIFGGPVKYERLPGPYWAITVLLRQQF